jgi:hypothetical protein
VGYRVAEIRAETPLLYNLRASLSDEINKLAEHLATIGITHLGLRYELTSHRQIHDGAAAASFIEQYRTGGGTAQLFAHSGANIEQLLPSAWPKSRCRASPSPR